MAKDRYTEERDKQEKAKRLRGKKANEIIVDPDIVVEPDPVVEEPEEDLLAGYNGLMASGTSDESLSY